MVCLPPLAEGTLGITASLTGELRFEQIPPPAHVGFSLHPCQAPARSTEPPPQSPAPWGDSEIKHAFDLDAGDALTL